MFNNLATKDSLIILISVSHHQLQIFGQPPRRLLHNLRIFLYLSIDNIHIFTMRLVMVGRMKYIV